MAEAVGLDRLASDLRSLGLRPGQDLLVHSSLSEIGWVGGGPGTLLRAIQDVAGPSATIVVFTQTPLTSRTSEAFRIATAGLSRNEIERFAAEHAAFDPQTTPSYGVGQFAEHVRTRPGASRSLHPQTSFAALGPAAAAITSGHDPDCHLGEQSPLRWLYDRDAAILLLGVTYAACTAFHLAEYRFAGEGAVRGSDLDDDDFHQIGRELERRWKKHPGPGGPQRGQVGMADSRLVPMRSAIDFAVGWMKKYRIPRMPDK